MGKLTIDLTKRDIPPKFKGDFTGKTYSVNMPDGQMEGATDKLKKPADLKDGDKLKNLLKNAKPVKEQIAPLFDDAKFTSDIDELGTHDFEVKFKGGVIIKASLQLLSQDGKESRVVISTEPRKLGSNPKSVKVTGSVASSCPYKDDLKHLVAQMGKTSSYVWSGKSGKGNGWTPQFDKHYTHTEDSIAGWKSYVDEPTMKTKTTWRLLFKLDFIEKSEQIVANIIVVQEEH